MGHQPIDPPDRPTRLWDRWWHAALALAAVVLLCGWWPAPVQAAMDVAKQV